MTIYSRKSSVSHSQQSGCHLKLSWYSPSTEIFSSWLNENNDVFQKWSIHFLPLTGWPIAYLQHSTSVLSALSPPSQAASSLCAASCMQSLICAFLNTQSYFLLVNNTYLPLFPLKRQCYSIIVSLRCQVTENLTQTQLSSKNNVLVYIK